MTTTNHLSKPKRPTLWFRHTEDKPHGIIMGSLALFLGRHTKRHISLHTRPKPWWSGMSPRPTWSSGFPILFLQNTGQSSDLKMVDIIYFALIIIFTGLIAWQVEKEIRKSKRHRKMIEESLEKERERLGLNLSGTTIEIIAAKKARTDELERVAQFGELSKGVFHDLIGPLSTVSLAVERLATKQSSPAETDAIVRTAVEASQRMGSFMQNIRTVIKSQTSDPKINDADITSELKTILEILRYKARMAGVSINIHRLYSTKLHIHPVRLQQLLLNLISNAIEACECTDMKTEKSVTIDIRKKRQSIIISISDNGPGIDPKYADDFFKKSFTTKPGGTGIGLLTARSIVEDELFGSITITNAPTSGAVCEVTIPLNKDEVFY